MSRRRNTRSSKSTSGGWLGWRRSGTSGASWNPRATITRGWLKPPLFTSSKPHSVIVFLSLAPSAIGVQEVLGTPRRFQFVSRRIKAGQRIKTCLKCGSIRRFGGGPKHHRIQRGGGVNE